MPENAPAGDINLYNDMAQENVFVFYTPGSSVPDPVSLEVAIRNPLERDTIVFLAEPQRAARGICCSFPLLVAQAWPPRGTDI